MNALLPWADLASAGGFSTVEAARLIGRSPKDIAKWMKGKKPLLLPDYEPLNRRLLLSFDALVEARAIGHFLGQGFDPTRLRRLLTTIRERSGVRHPLARDQTTVTDGFRLIEANNDTLINLVNDVYMEPRLMKPALKGFVAFEGGRAAYLVPEPERAPLVRVDPHHAFGRPIIFDCGRVVTTLALADSAEDEGVEVAADWFGVSPAAAMQALEFERHLRG